MTCWHWFCFVSVVCILIFQNADIIRKLRKQIIWHDNAYIAGDLQSSSNAVSDWPTDDLIPWSEWDDFFGNLDDVSKWKHLPRHWPFICAGNSSVLRWIPTKWPVMRSFDVFFDLRPNIRLSKQSWGWWFETPSRQLWRLCIFKKIFTLIPLSRSPSTKNPIRNNQQLYPNLNVVSFGWSMYETSRYRCRAISMTFTQRLPTGCKHYSGVIMSAMASQITSLTSVCSTVYAGAYKRKHQSSASLALVRGIPRRKDQQHGKCFHLMTSSWGIFNRKLWFCVAVQLRHQLLLRSISYIKMIWYFVGFHKRTFTRWLGYARF